MRKGMFFIILVTVLLISMQLVSASVTSVVEMWTTLIENNFESDTIGAIPSGVSAYAIPSIGESVVVAGSSEDKYVELFADRSGCAVADPLISTSADISADAQCYKLSFNVMAGNISDKFDLFMKDLSNNKYAYFLTFRNGNIYCLNEEVGLSYLENKWYAVDVIIYTATNKASVIINGQTYINEKTMLRKTVPALNYSNVSFTYRLTNDIADTASSVFIDDIVLKQRGDDVQIYTDHPFLITKEAEYTEMRARALTYPWSAMGTGASGGAPDMATTVAYQTRCNNLADKMSVCGLAFILDPTNQAGYVTKIYNYIQYWKTGVTGNLYDDLYVDSDSDWNYAIPPAGAFVDTLLAYDIVYNYMTEAQRLECDAIIDNVGNWFWNHMETHPVGIWGARTVYSIFKGDTEKAKTAASNYLSNYYNFFTDDGVSPCPSYALTRFANFDRRDSKTGVVDILEYTGFNNNIYNSSKFRGINEWLLGYSFAPNTRGWTFGDTGFTAGDSTRMKQSWTAFRANNVSDVAAGFAAWHLKDNIPTGRLWNFPLLKTALPDPVVPQSRIFRDGGAYFYDDLSDRSSLAGAMQSVTSEGGHVHKEVNAFCLAGFGEILMANAGYSGWGSSAGGYSWDYIYNRAISANTLLFNYSYLYIQSPLPINDHSGKTGNGIIDGFTTDSIDFARGDSGSAISNGRHYRDFLFVHPQDGAGGYFVTVDDARATSANATVDVSLRPASSSYTTVTASTEYQWNIANFTTDGVQLSLYLATAPTSVSIIDGIIADQSDDKCVPIKAMFNKYSAGSSGKKRIVTFMVPWKTNVVAKPTMSRLTTGSYTGGTLNFNGGITDTVLESAASTAATTYDGLTIHGETTVYRKTNGTLGFYLVRNSSQFGTSTTGFYTPNGELISISMNAAEGAAYTSSATNCVFKGSYTGVNINGNAATVTTVSDGIRVTLPKGESKIVLTTGENTLNAPVVSSSLEISPLETLKSDCGCSE